MANIAFIADMKDSKNMGTSKRIDAQQKLSDIADFANSVYGKGMKYKLDFSSGDSIQGLFKSPSSAFCCYFFIRSAFFPYEMRCGIGAGSLIDMPYRSSNMMDGTSYHNARNILTFSKDNGYDMLFGSGCKEDDFVNRYLAAAQALMSKQSRKQRIVDNLISLTDPLITDDVDTKEYNKGIRRFIESCAEIYRDSDRTTGDYSFTAAAPSVNLSELAYRSNIFFNMKTVGRNNQTMIGRMLNVSSENIRQMMIKGDVEMIRSLLIGASLSAEQCLCEG